MNKPEPQPSSEVPADQPDPASGENTNAGAPGTQALPPEQISRFVTSIKNAEQQVGEHVIAALQHEGTVAVLTTVVIGPGGQQHIVSAALDGATTAQVNKLLQGATEQRIDEETCVGFHCLIKPKSGQSESPKQ